MVKDVPELGENQFNSCQIHPLKEDAFLQDVISQFSQVFFDL
jgi:uncharacterized protein (DUF169 family)